MKIFKDKKAFFTTHPLTWGIAGLVIGLILMFLIAKGIIPIPLGICPSP